MIGKIKNKRLRTATAWIVMPPALFILLVIVVVSGLLKAVIAGSVAMVIAFVGALSLEEWPSILSDSWCIMTGMEAA